MSNNGNRPRSGLLILLLAYAAFIGLGLVNSLLGVTWRNGRSLP